MLLLFHAVLFVIYNLTRITIVQIRTAIICSFAVNLASQRIKDVVQQNALKHLVFEHFRQKEETNLSEESIYAQLLSKAVARR